MSSAWDRPAACTSWRSRPPEGTLRMPAPGPPVYDTIGRGYSTHRQADPRWAALINGHLAGARRVANVGAGTGSYEPSGVDVDVVAIEPSALMVSQRGAGSAPV